MKLSNDAKRRLTIRKPHPELGGIGDPTGLLEHREGCLRAIQRVLSIATIRNIDTGGYRVQRALLHPEKKMRAIEFAADNYAQWEIECLRHETALDVEQLEAILAFEEKHPILFSIGKFLNRSDTSVRSLTIRRELLEEYLSILNFVPDEASEEIPEQKSNEPNPNNTIDESI